MSESWAKVVKFDANNLFSENNKRQTLSQPYHPEYRKWTISLRKKVTMLMLTILKMACPLANSILYVEDNLPREQLGEPGLFWKKDF